MKYLMKATTLLVILVATPSAVAAEPVNESTEPEALWMSREPTELDPITVYQRGDPFGPGLKGLRDAIPCLGCDSMQQRAPLMLDVGKAAGLWALGVFFQQPRVRGEANDEAFYYALRAAQCIDDSPSCLDRQPNSGLYNWKPSDNVQDDIILNLGNSILQSK